VQKKSYGVLVVGTSAYCFNRDPPSSFSVQNPCDAIPYQFPFRGVGSPRTIGRGGGHAASEYTPFPEYYAEFRQHPYTTRQVIRGIGLRSRILGGRTLPWADSHSGWLNAL